jgi:hypothetical protein
MLLCAHHYRISRHALIIAEAAICELPGIPGDVAEWIDSKAPEPGVRPADRQ